jgi:hypothetical protein
MIKRHSAIRMSFFYSTKLDLHNCILFKITLYGTPPFDMSEIRLNHFENSSLKVMISLSIQIFLSDDNEQIKE